MSETKADLQERVDELEAKLAATEAKNDELESALEAAGASAAGGLVFGPGAVPLESR